MTMRALRVLLFICISVAACEGRAWAAAGPPAYLQGVEGVALPNGLRALVAGALRTALFSEILLVVRAGTGTRGPGEEEVARVVGSAVSAGRRLPETPPVDLELARLGASLDFTIGRELAVFRFGVPTRNTRPFLHLLANLLRREVLSDETWAEAIARRRREFARERSDPWQRASSELARLVWGLGSEDRPLSPPALSPRAAEYALLNDFWRRAYAPRNMVLSVWGELPISDLMQTVEAEFGALPAGVADPVSMTRQPARTRAGAVRCMQESGADPAALLVGLGAEASSEDEFYAWQLAAHILGASYNSRLQQRLRNDSQVVYSVEATSVPIGRSGMMLRIATQTDELQSARAVILAELRRLTLEPVAEPELEFARALLSSRLKLDSASLRDRFYRRSLEVLSLDGVHDPSRAEDSIVGFTPKKLLELLSRSLRPDEASSVIVSRHPEPLCEADHEAKQ